MIAIDTNILVHAFRLDSDNHKKADAAIQGLADQSVSWTIPWPCVHEFISVVTNPKIFRVPSTLAEALNQVRAWKSACESGFLHEAEDHLLQLENLPKDKIRGGIIHDARIACICLSHSVSEFWTADRDFLLFPKLKIRNPL